MALHGEANEGRMQEGFIPALRMAVEAGAFLCELAMLAVLAIGGWGLGSGGLMSIALAIFYPALAIPIWSLWMAPSSARRLPDPWRLIVQVALFAATGVVAGLGGHPALGSAFAVVAIVVFAATRRSGGPTCSGHQAGSSSS